MRIEYANGRNNYLRQIISTYYDSETYVRNYRDDEGGKVWSSWLSYVRNSDLESVGFPRATIMTDLHTIQQSCFFMYIAGAANAPLSDRGGIGICIYAGNAWRYLLVIPYNTIDMYVSTINSEGLWTTWTKK